MSATIIIKEARDSDGIAMWFGNDVDNTIPYLLGQAIYESYDYTTGLVTQTILEKILQMPDVSYPEIWPGNEELPGEDKVIVFVCGEGCVYQANRRWNARDFGLLSNNDGPLMISEDIFDIWDTVDYSQWKELKW